MVSQASISPWSILRGLLNVDVNVYCLCRVLQHNRQLRLLPASQLLLHRSPRQRPRPARSKLVNYCWYLSTKSMHGQKWSAHSPWHWASLHFTGVLNDSYAQPCKYKSILCLQNSIGFWLPSSIIWLIGVIKHIPSFWIAQWHVSLTTQPIRNWTTVNRFMRSFHACIPKQRPH